MQYGEVGEMIRVCLLFILGAVLGTVALVHPASAFPVDGGYVCTGINPACEICIGDCGWQTASQQCENFGLGPTAMVVGDISSYESCNVSQPTCTQSTETDNPSCPNGQVGSITRTRTINTGGTCGNTSAWTETQNTCTTPTTYVWQTGSWEACSASCGGGTQNRSVTCHTSGGTYVGNDDVSGPCGTNKPNWQQACNTQACAGPVCLGEATCGTSQGGSFQTAPASGLCLMGNASDVTESNGTYNWTCSAGGTPASCSATKVTSTACMQDQGAYEYVNGSWTPNLSPNWVIPGWSNGPWWGSNRGNELEVYTSSGLRVTGVRAVSATKMQCNGASAPPAWVEGPWGDWDCSTHRRQRVVECKNSDGEVFEDSECAGTGPARVETWTQVPAQCVVPVNGECDPRSHGRSFPSSTPNINLCTEGTASAVTESAGVFKWTCSGVNGGQPSSCEAYRGCAAGQTEQMVQEIAPLGSRWAWGGCAEGEVPGHLRDVRPDGRHSLGEDGKDKGTNNYHLCITGAPANSGLEIAWQPGGCQAGWGQLEFYTDSPSNINLNSTHGKAANYRYCYRATGANYTAGGKRYDRGASGGAKTPPPYGSARIVNSEGSSSGWYVGSSANDDEASFYVWLYHTRPICVTDCTHPASVALPECQSGYDNPVCRTKPWICEDGGGGGGGRDTGLELPTLNAQ